MTTIAKNSASARLLSAALESGATYDVLAAALGVRHGDLEDWLAVRERMPLAQQVALAEWVERHLPRLAQRARRLRAQAAAAAALARGDTERHAYPPPRA